MIVQREVLYKENKCSERIYIYDTTQTKITIEAFLQVKIFQDMGITIYSQVELLQKLCKCNSSNQIFMLLNLILR